MGKYLLAVVLFLVLFAVITVYFVASNSSSGGDDSLIDSFSSVFDQRVRITEFSQLSETPQELTDGTRFFGSAVFGTSDSMSIYALSGSSTDFALKRFDRASGSTEYSTATTAASDILIPTFPYDYISASISADNAILVILATSSSLEVGRLFVLNADLNSIATLSLTDVIDPSSVTFDGPRVSVLSDNYMVSWVTSAGVIRYVLVDAAGNSSGAVQTAVTDAAAAAKCYAQNATGQLLVLVDASGLLREYTYVSGAYELSQVFAPKGQSDAYWGSNVVISDSGLRMAVSSDVDEHMQGGVWVYHRNHVSSPWLRSTDKITTNHRGLFNNERYGAIMHIFKDDYLFIGGALYDTVDLWYLDKVVSTPRYFFTLSAVHPVSRVMFVSPELVEDRVWVAMGSAEALRPSVSDSGRITIYNVSASTREIQVGDQQAEPDASMSTGIASCEVGKWSTSNLATIFSGEDPVFIFQIYYSVDGSQTPQPNPTAWYQVRSDIGGGHAAMMMNNGAYQDSPDSDAFRYTVQRVIVYDVGAAAAVYNDTPSYLDSRTGWDRDTCYVGLSYSTSNAGMAFVMGSSVFVSTPSDPDTLNSSFVVEGRGAGIGFTSDGNYIWVATSEGFGSYSRTGNLVQAVSGVGFKMARTAYNNRVYAVGADGVSLYLFEYADGVWTLSFQLEPGNEIVDAQVSTDLLTIAVYGAYNDTRIYTRPRGLQLFTRIDDVVNDPTGFYEQYFVPSKSRRAENCIRGSRTIGEDHAVTDGSVLLHFRYTKRFELDDPSNPYTGHYCPSCWFTYYNNIISISSVLC